MTDNTYIIWTAVGSIGSLLAFIGVIITIIYNSRINNKNNDMQRNYMESQIRNDALEKRYLEIRDKAYEVLQILCLNNLSYNITSDKGKNIRYLIVELGKDLRKIDFILPMYFSGETGLKIDDFKQKEQLNSKGVTGEYVYFIYHKQQSIESFYSELQADFVNSVSDEDIITKIICEKEKYKAKNNDILLETTITYLARLREQFNCKIKNNINARNYF